MRLSVIIPCYKAERYICQCLDSVFRIPLPSSEYEVICFDDKAPDNTPCILDDYACAHSNMEVLHSQVNVGPGDGRNRALRRARGEYIWFVDADDMIVPDVVSTLLKQAEDDDLDVLIFDYQDIDEDKNPVKMGYNMKDTKVMNGREIGNIAFNGGIVNNMGYPWRFFLRNDYIRQNGIIFPKGMTYGEDTVWMAKVVLLADHIQASSQCAYLYWHHETSTCGQMNKSYPGKTIYERCILTASQMFEFACEIRKKDGAGWGRYADEIERYGRTHYMNQLPIMLGRSSRKERKDFYKRWGSSNLQYVHGMANRITRYLLTPYFGCIIADVLTIGYKLTHKK